ncbi:hypothetical protein DSO57_1021874 [Entomophthora muscae]|uniref:Uncharacterized protein n=1 Tax=Entomophthora muscae TaxID=34485 RepID=A0ACC2TQ85_9FUNG|nr:hypothetical protein DSO57_1021874 [Entomophthora muscae]
MPLLTVWTSMLASYALQHFELESWTILQETFQEERPSRLHQDSKCKDTPTLKLYPPYQQTSTCSSFIAFQAKTPTWSKSGIEGQGIHTELQPPRSARIPASGEDGSVYPRRLQPCHTGWDPSRTPTALKLTPCKANWSLK